MARIRRCLPLLLMVILLAGCLETAEPFSDDFSDPESGWGSATPEEYLRTYQAGRYAIEVDVPNLLVWTTPGRVYQDVEISVRLSSERALDNHYGVLCRYTQGAFYYFAISADGYYAIFHRMEDGDLIPLTGQAMLRSPVIRTDGMENELLAVCDGSELSLYVNGELVAQAQDKTLERGDVGIAAGTLDQANTLVWFDDFEADVP
ncbi:MAG: hypothetical protein JXA21_23310 [Anaerolineae bacterium]|nr:hypothetical protein [Anaerolineae bacterium]